MNFLTKLINKLSGHEEFLWVGDGIGIVDDPAQRIGRLVNINGRKGTVVAASPLTITVKWDINSLFLRRMK